MSEDGEDCRQVSLAVNAKREAVQQHKEYPMSRQVLRLFCCLWFEALHEQMSVLKRMQQPINFPGPRL